MSAPRVSIVINTLNRAESLGTTLEALQWIAYAGEFEVVVVNGPSTDSTEALLAPWSDRVVLERCPVANLSVSRNIGIAASSGEIVAFIDDDAVPEPEWLGQLVAAFGDPLVGAAGGYVLDHTGVAYQSTYALFTRLGDPVASPGRASPERVFPYSFTFPHLIGTNMAFRRTALDDVGGFDEQYEYYLDDTDLVVRIIDRGYDVRQVSGAHLHHRFAPSTIRDHRRVARHRYPVVKNHAYFALRHGLAFYDERTIIDEQRAFAHMHQVEMVQAVADGLIDRDDLDRFLQYRDEAVDTGLRAARAVGPTAHRGQLPRGARGSVFRRFPTIVEGPEIVRRVLVAGPGAASVAAARERGRALAAEGQIVHLIAPTPHRDHIDFDHGVWISAVDVSTSPWRAARARGARRLTERFASTSA
jgi:glycosyltransferase involved in cell wall biosynthesis